MGALLTHAGSGSETETDCALAALSALADSSSFKADSRYAGARVQSEAAKHGDIFGVCATCIRWLRYRCHVVYAQVH